MPTNACPYRRGIRTVLRTALLLLIGLAPCWASDETAGTKTAGKSEALTRLLAGLKARQERVKSFHFTWDTHIETMRGWPGPTTCLLDGVLNRNGRFSNDDVEYSISPSELWGDGAGRLRDEYLLFRQKQQQDTARSVRVRNLIDGTIRGPRHHSPGPRRNANDDRLARPGRHNPARSACARRTVGAVFMPKPGR